MPQHCLLDRGSPPAHLMGPKSTTRAVFLPLMCPHYQGSWETRYGARVDVLAPVAYEPVSGALHESSSL